MLSPGILQIIFPLNTPPFSQGTVQTSEGQMWGGVASTGREELLTLRLMTAGFSHAVNRPAPLRA